MKFAAILSLCLVATAVATPHSANVRSRRQTDSSTTICPGSATNGTATMQLSGTLGQVGNLLGNLLDNVLRLRILNGNGNSLNQLTDLTDELQDTLSDLLSNSSNITDDDINETRPLLETLTADIVTLLNTLLPDDEASSWPCTAPTGPLGTTLTTVIEALGDITSPLARAGGNGSLVVTLQRVVLQLISSLLRVLL